MALSLEHLHKFVSCCRLTSHRLKRYPPFERIVHCARFARTRCLGCRPLPAPRDDGISAFWFGDNKHKTKQSITIQWERLPRKEREKLDRQQHLISSRFRVTEQVRRESSFSLSVVPSPGVYSRIGPSGDSGSGNDGGGGSSNSHHHPTTAVGDHNSDGSMLPPSDAAISSSIDRPQSGGNHAAGAGTDVVADPDTRGSSNDELAERVVKVEAGSLGAAAGNGTSRYPVAKVGGPMHVMETPWAQRRRRGAGGTGKRGSSSGVRCGVPDADIASGLARRGRLGDSSLGIIGRRTSILSEDQ